MKETLYKIINSKYFVIVGLALVFLVCQFAIVDIATKQASEKTANELYEKAYIQGFRKARSYEIKDTAELNHIYPTYKLMMKYEPFNIIR